MCPSRDSAAGGDRPPRQQSLPADLVRLVPAAVYTARTGAEGEWLYASPQIEAILGFSASEFVADPGLWARRLHPDDRGWVLAEEQGVLFGDADRSYAEYRLIARDGRTVWVLDDVTLLPDATYGSLQHGLLFDITQRKRTEMLLGEQADLFGRIARGDSLPAVLRALEASVRTVTGARGCTVLVRSVEDGAEQSVADPAGGRPPNAPTQPRDDEPVERLVFGDGEGRPLGELVVTGMPRDPDLRTVDGCPDLDWALRLAALAVGRARQEEREATSFSLLEATLESTADGILVVDAHGRIAGHNQKFRQMWQVPPEIIATRNDDQLLEYVMAQLRDRDAFLAEVRRLYASPGLSSFDEIEFHDGRVFERYSQPQLLDGRAVGRVWSFRDVTDYRRLEAELRRQAHTDALTGLPNRHMFMDRLTQLSAERADATYGGQGLGLLLIDVDDFKTVNDGLGHLAGDAMLVALAERVERAVRPGDVAARLGGDEFAVLLSGPADPETARTVADRIISTLAEPIDLGGRMLSIRASIGIALSAEGTPVADLVRNADLAMYVAKRSGGASYRFYELSMHLDAVARLHLKADLGRALDDNGLSVVYQPIVSLQTGRIESVEALARWEHPELGAIPPVEFVRLAEETGLIDRLGAWVLAHACAEVARWHARYGEGGAPTVNVNLSPQQLSNPALVSEVERVLGATGLPAGAVCLEITESALARPDADIAAVLRDISALGVRLALDDFGTGHSSLARLGTYPFDVVKIDRSFVGRLVESRSDQAVVEAVLRIAEAFDLEVVAEGIENTGQLDALVSLGCGRGQGFLFSRPLVAEQMHRLLASARPAGRAHVDQLS